MGIVLQHIDTIIYLAVTILGVIIGYVKLQGRVKLNDKLIQEVKNNCIICKSDMKLKFKEQSMLNRASIEKLHELMNEIKNTLANIGRLLSSISALINTYINIMEKK